MKSKTLVIVGTVAVSVAALAFFSHTPIAPASNFLQGASSEVEEAFIQYLAEYGKSYASKDAIPRRFEIFSRNYEMIQRHNSNPESLYKMGLNPYSDMEKHEYLHPLSVDSADLDDAIYGEELLGKIQLSDQDPTSVDWRLTNKLSPVPNAGLVCNSQWAFTAASAIESAMAIDQKEPFATHQASVQYLLDCDSLDKGCAGGWPSRTYKFVQNKGYAHIKKYPFTYQGRVNLCQLMQKSDLRLVPTLRSRQYLMIYPDMMKHFVRFQPVAVAINFPACVSNYKSGIVNQAECQCSAENYSQVNVDAMFLVVGYG